MTAKTKVEDSKEEVKSEVVKAEKPVKVKTESNKIWDEIKDLKVSMFALPAKPVSSYCSQIEIDEKKLFLKFKVPSFLPLLEEVLAGSFEVDLMDKYIVVTRKAK